MKKQTTPPITEFEDTHDGAHAKTVYLAAIGSREFANPVQALQAFIELRDALLQIHDQPAKMIPAFEQITAGLTDPQKLFLAQRIKFYFKNTVFGVGEQKEGEEGETLTEIIEAVCAYINRLERSIVPQVADIRATLKEVFRKEIERLPSVLETLEGKDRLNFLCKLMPFVLPKVEAVEATRGESTMLTFRD